MMAHVVYLFHTVRRNRYIFTFHSRGAFLCSHTCISAAHMDERMRTIIRNCTTNLTYAPKRPHSPCCARYDVSNADRCGTIHLTAHHRHRSSLMQQSDTGRSQLQNHVDLSTQLVQRYSSGPINETRCKRRQHPIFEIHSSPLINRSKRLTHRKLPTEHSNMLHPDVA